MSMQASMPSPAPSEVPVVQAAPGPKANPSWGQVLASVFAVAFDLVMVFFVGGYAIAYLTGNIKNGEFNLSSRPAMLLLVLIFAYFIICMKFFGGTLWQRTLRVGRR